MRRYSSLEREREREPRHKNAKGTYTAEYTARWRSFGAGRGSCYSSQTRQHSHQNLALRLELDELKNRLDDGAGLARSRGAEDNVRDLRGTRPQKQRREPSSQEGRQGGKGGTAKQSRFTTSPVPSRSAAPPSQRRVEAFHSILRADLSLRRHLRGRVKHEKKKNQRTPGVSSQKVASAFCLQAAGRCWHAAARSAKTKDGFVAALP